MATDTRPLKGILKKPAGPSVTNSSGSSSNTGAAAAAVLNPRKQDPREIALQHARIIQQRKDLELEILECLALLSEYPTERGSRLYSAAHPSPRDAADFKANVRLFQPSDYDDLIEERNVNGLCGYTLCAQPKPPASKGGEWRLVNFGTSSFDIVNRKESEKWCSKDCQRRALYVKVQLNETAAWERAGIPDIEIELLGEHTSAKEEDPAAQATRDLANLRLEETRRVADESATLALERGEVRQEGKKTFTLAIREREVQPPADDNGFFAEPDDAHLLVEGHRPGTGKAQARAEASQAEAQFRKENA